MPDRFPYDSPDGGSLNPRDTAMDNLLRQSMSAPVPQLSPDFDRVLARRLKQRSRKSRQFSQTLLAVYIALSIVTCVIVMRSQGLGWIAITVTTLAPLAALELARRLRRRQLSSAAS